MMQCLDGQSRKDLQTAIDALRRGQLVAVPSETVYGLAAHALDPAAVRKIFLAKGRPWYDPLIVHLSEWSQCEDLALPDPVTRVLADAFWPGPLTVVLPRREQVPDLVTAGNSTVALRMPSHPVFRRLLQESRLPLAAPSANPFGATSPTRPAHVRNALDGRIDFILDGGACEHGVESTIVKVSEGRITLLRPGPIPRSRIAAAAGIPVEMPKPPPREREVRPEAPGGLERHYSPRKPLRLVPRTTLESIKEDGVARLFLTPFEGLSEEDLVLSPDGRPETVARVLYASLHALDANPSIRTIEVEAAPAEESWDAVRDRLSRAAG